MYRRQSVIMKSVWSVIVAYLLYSNQKNISGEPLSDSRRRSIKRLAAFNILRRERLRLRTVLRLANIKMKRRWWVRPIFAEREVTGAWFTLIPTLREFDSDEYFNFMRMTPECFDWLLALVSPVLTKHSNRAPISSGERLAVTLRYLASGDSHKSLSYLFRISVQAISNIVLEATAAIWFVLRDVVFEPLSVDMWRRKAAEFESMWQFPMRAGAMDGKHVFVRKFPMRGSEHYNYKFGHSVILFAVSDAKYKFVVVDVGARGRESDGGVFERSEFGQLFNNHQLCLPPPVFNKDLNCHLPYLFLGDDAFSFGEHLMKPYGDAIAYKPEEIIFNYRLSRARRVVENSFGIMASRFRIFQSNINGSETLVQNIILAAVALHNLHLTREDSVPPKQRVYLPPDFADVYKSNGKLKRGRWRNELRSAEFSLFKKLVQQENIHAHIESASFIRDKLTEYFLLRPLPWQYDDLPNILMVSALLGS